MNEKRYCKQNLNEFVKGFIGRCKNGERAIFKCIEGNEIIFRDVPESGQHFNKIMKSQPETLIGIYNSSAKPEWVLGDLR